MKKTISLVLFALLLYSANAQLGNIKNVNNQLNANLNQTKILVNILKGKINQQNFSKTLKNEGVPTLDSTIQFYNDDGIMDIYLNRFEYNNAGLNTYWEDDYYTEGEDYIRK